MKVTAIDRPGPAVLTPSGNASADVVGAEQAAPRSGAPTRAHARLILAGFPSGLLIEPPRVTPKAPPAQTPPDDGEQQLGSGSHTTDIIQDRSLLLSPALLFDYQSWNRDRTAAYARGSASNAYIQLALMLYDRQIGRPWEDADYARAMTERLAEFRRHFSNEGQNLCDLPEQVVEPAQFEQLVTALRDPRLLVELADRHGLNVHPAQFLNRPRPFNLVVDRAETNEGESLSLWRMAPREVRWRFATPVLSSVDSYQAGFFDRTFPAQFAVAGNDVIVDDSELRDRSMAFAHQWKFQVRVAQNGRRDNPVYNAESLQYRLLSRDLQGEMQAMYERLLPRVASNPATTARFERERAAGDFPVEVYQHVAYGHFRELERLHSGYYALARDQRAGTDDRHLGLEALLTLQRYSPSWRFLLTELITQSNPLTAHAVLIDQMIDPRTARGFAAEQIKAILGMEVYGNANLYDRMRYAVLADELFDAGYMRERQPALFAELARPDGTLRSVSELPREDQIRILRAYLTDANGQVDGTALLRMLAVFASRIREADYRELATVIHDARLPNS